MSKIQGHSEIHWIWGAETPSLQCQLKEGEEHSYWKIFLPSQSKKLCQYRASATLELDYYIINVMFILLSCFGS